jgi:NAD(P)-dependent dehydrogenase (short-subunit alcohol dehydrogenase family)
MTASAVAGARFAGRSVIVTGAASGIGLATTHRLVNEGARVLAVDMHAEALKDHFDDAPNVDSLVVDLGDPAAAERVADAARSCLRTVDVLVNNAARRDGFALMLSTDLDTWNAVFAVNVTAPFLLAQAILPSMLERGSGVVVNIASIAALGGGKGGTAYTASKHALLGLTRSIAAQYGSHGIRAVAIAPGGVATPGRSGLHSPDPDGVAMLDRTRSARLRMGTPDDIAGLVSFLASDDAALINGACMVADGAWTAH